MALLTACKSTCKNLGNKEQVRELIKIHLFAYETAGQVCGLQELHYLVIHVTNWKTFSQWKNFSSIYDAK